jgi:NAD(P)-dependent dehydrogenase (short-subunit alcohol dehydrogenase family)
MGILSGKAVVITGAGRGLGRAYAEAAAREGAGVVVNGIDVDPAHEIASAIDAQGGKAAAHVGSVADWSAAAGLIDRCVERFGRIDGLVNNAGTH